MRGEDVTNDGITMELTGQVKNDQLVGNGGRVRDEDHGYTITVLPGMGRHLGNGGNVCEG